MSVTTKRPPRENLVRAVFPGPTLERASANAAPTMRGEFAVFNQWTEINSMWEGKFMESIAPGAFRKTMKENRAGIRALFQHGNDPQVGDKPLGSITDLRETDTGAAYEVQLLDAPYVRDLVLPGLEAGLYGASFRFQVMKEEITEEPQRSSYNPNGMPERVITECRVAEFGPVTFPAYPGASAGVRSMTDEFVVGRFAHNPEALGRALALMNYEIAEVEQEEEDSEDGAEGRADDPALSGDGAGDDHSDVESRDSKPGEFVFWFAR